MKFLKRKISTVFIMLGTKCNMSCKYCLQKPITEKALSENINPNIYDFLEEIEKESGEVHLRFYGGEPLLYFKNIKEIVETLSKRKIKASYSVISNGKAMTKDMADFFNEYNIHLAISWDGFNTKKTRGFDVFSDKNLKSIIFKIKSLSVTGVINSLVYPIELLDAFQKLADEYKTETDRILGINIDEIFDTGISNKKLLDINYKRVSREMHFLTKEYIDNLNQLKLDNNDVKRIYILGFIRRLKNFLIDKKGINDCTSPCKNGISILNLDIKGNLYACHNVVNAVGTIYDSYFDYLQEILKTDDTKLYLEECKKCKAYYLCRGGCKLVNRKTRKESYCKLKRAVFIPVIKAIEKYGG